MYSLSPRWRDLSHIVVKIVRLRRHLLRKAHSQLMKLHLKSGQKSIDDQHQRHNGKACVEWTTWQTPRLSFYPKIILEQATRDETHQVSLETRHCCSDNNPHATLLTPTLSLRSFKWSRRVGYWGYIATLERWYSDVYLSGWRDAWSQILGNMFSRVGKFRFNDVFCWQHRKVRITLRPCGKLIDDRIDCFRELSALGQRWEKMLNC